jgi:hypothetical protein
LAGALGYRVELVRDARRGQRRSIHAAA